MNNPYICPICHTILARNGSTLNVEEIFNQWNNLHTFSQYVVREHVNQSAVTSLYECPKCLLEIFFPQVIGTEKFYEELQEDIHFAYYREDKWDFFEALKDLEGLDSIIEIGCGPGSFLEKAKPRLKKACGTEFNKSALKIAQSKGLEVYGNEDDMKSLEATFDAVFSFHVLEHVPDPICFIKEISSFVKPGGKICLSVPNQDGPIKNISDSLMNIPPHHATHWQLKTIRILAEKLDLQISRVAFEPLLLENHNYYSHYWINSFLTDKTKIQRIAKRILSMLMELFFRFLIKMKFKHFKLLRGQAIYIVMKKMEV